MRNQFQRDEKHSRKVGGQSAEKNLLKHFHTQKFGWFTVGIGSLKMSTYYGLWKRPKTGLYFN